MGYGVYWGSAGLRFFFGSFLSLLHHHVYDVMRGLDLDSGLLCHCVSVCELWFVFLFCDL
jgi:hypothetical protein